MPLPTFVIAGAQKCGTSSLSATLRLHPEIFMARPKELHFFDRRHTRGQEWYEAHFTPAAGEVQLGEATPVYMYDADARRRMAETIPGARVVVILRDPVSRAYSHYWHERRLGREPLDSFEEALAAEPERLRSTRRLDRTAHSYVDRGHYVDQIESLVAGHGREGVHVTLLEDLTQDRVGTLRRILEFLQVDPAAAADLPELRTNVYRVSNAEGQSVAVDYEPMAPSTRARLVETFRDSNLRLANFLGRDLSHWNRV